MFRNAMSMRSLSLTVLSPGEVLGFGNRVAPFQTRWRHSIVKHHPVSARLPGQILDKFIPLERSQMPSILSPRGWRFRWANIKSSIASTLRSVFPVFISLFPFLRIDVFPTCSVGRLKRKLGSWSAVSFAEDAERRYEQMNKAFNRLVSPTHIGMVLRSRLMNHHLLSFFLFHLYSVETRWHWLK